MTGEQQGDGPLLPPNPSGQERRDEPLLPRSGNKPQEEEPQGNRRLAARTEARGRRRTGGRTTEGEAGDDRPQQAEMMRRRRRRSTGRRWGGRIRDLQIRRGQRRPRREDGGGRTARTGMAWTGAARMGDEDGRLLLLLRRAGGRTAALDGRRGGESEDDGCGSRWQRIHTGRGSGTVGGRQRRRLLLLLKKEARRRTGRRRRPTGRGWLLSAAAVRTTKGNGFGEAGAGRRSCRPGRKGLPGRRSGGRGWRRRIGEPKAVIPCYDMEEKERMNWSVILDSPKWGIYST